MNTKDRIVHYHDLLRTDPQAAADFRKANEHDQRFIAILDLHDKIVPAFKAIGRKHLDTLNAALREDDATISQAMVESVVDNIAEEVRETVGMTDCSEEHTTAEDIEEASRNIIRGIEENE